MSKKINIEEILDKHAVKRTVEGKGGTYECLFLFNLKPAIKEITELIVDKCSNNARMYKEETTVYKDGKFCAPYQYRAEENLTQYDGNEGYNEDPITVYIDKQSILKVKEEVQYEN